MHLKTDTSQWDRTLLKVGGHRVQRIHFGAILFDILVVVVKIDIGACLKRDFECVLDVDRVVTALNVERVFGSKDGGLLSNSKMTNLRS